MSAKKVIKVIFWIIGLILILLLACIIALQSSKVQTWLAGKVTEKLENSIDGKIEFSRIHISPLDGVVIQDLVILDENPYSSENFAPVDTFVRAESLTAGYSLRRLFSKKDGIGIRNVRLSNAEFNMVTEPDPEDSTKSKLNLTRIFKLGNDDDDDDDEINLPKLKIGKLDVENFRYTLRDAKHPKKGEEGEICWKDLDIRNINLHANRFNMGGTEIGAKVDELSFKEKSGYEVTKASGDVVAGNNVTKIENLKLSDKWSDISMDSFTMDYTNGFNDFLHKVRIDADIKNSTLDFKTLGYYAKALQKMDQKFEMDGTYSGYVNDFKIGNIKFKELNSGVTGTLDGRLMGIPKTSMMALDANAKDLQFTTESLSTFIKGFAPSVNLNLGKFAPGTLYTYNGSVEGLFNDLKINGDITSNSGNAIANVNLKNMLNRSTPMEIGGNINMDSMDLGHILGTNELGECTGVVDVDATLGKKLTARVNSLDIDRIYAHGYNYNNISGSGYWDGSTFDGNVSANDPNLKMNGDIRLTPKAGIGDNVLTFNGSVDNADLYALNLDKRGVSNVSFTADAEIWKNETGALEGKADFKDLVLTDERGTHNLGDLVANLGGNGSDAEINFDSSFAEGTFKGNYSTFIKDVRSLTVDKELPSLTKKDPAVWSGNTYDVDLTLRNAKDLLSYALPGLYISDGTKVKMKIDSTGSLKGNIKSQRLAYSGKSLKNADIDINNDNNVLNCDIKADEINVSPIQLKNGDVKLTANADNIALKASYDNETELQNKGEIDIIGKIGRSPSGKLTLDAKTQKSDILLNSDPWRIGESDISLKDGRIKIDNLTLSGTGQSINIDGGISSKDRDSLRVDLNRFNLEAINAMTGKDLGLGGRATGKAILASPTSNHLSLIADMSVDDMMISDQPMGRLDVDSHWDNSIKGMVFHCFNDMDGKKTIEVDGKYITSSKNIDGDIYLNNFNIGYAAPFVTSIFPELGGNLSGIIKANGPLSKMDIETEGLNIADGFLRVGFTNVLYHLNGPLHINNEGVFFDDIAITDEKNEKGTAKGGLNWDHFKNMNFATTLDFRDLMLLDIPSTTEMAFYGTVYGTGKLNITGPINALVLDGDARTSKSGEFHLPLSSTSSASSSDLLIFKEPDQIVVVDPYEEMMGKIKSAKTSSKSDLGVKLNLRVNPETSVNIEVDTGADSYLVGKGRGQIEMEVWPSRDIFTLNGGYNLTEGNFHLNIMDFTARDFAIQEGSSVKFGGNVMDIDLDVDAVYKTKASLGTLIADTTSTTRRLVECGIKITDKLKNPQLAFSVEIPDLDPTTQAQVDAALNTEYKVQKQFMSLLVSGSFMPDENSGVVRNSNLLNTTVSEIMSSQLNSIFQKLDIPLDFGLGIQQTSSGKSLYDVAISTELFNNRVIVNGTIGNRMYNTSNSNEVVGDIDIEIKLDKPGTLRLNLFSRSADQYTRYLDNSQRNGIGITYQREFNNLREFLRNIFRGRARQEGRREDGPQMPRGPMDNEKVKISIEE